MVQVKKHKRKISSLRPGTFVSSQNYKILMVIELPRSGIFSRQYTTKVVTPRGAVFSLLSKYLKPAIPTFDDKEKFKRYSFHLPKSVRSSLFGDIRG